MRKIIITISLLLTCIPNLYPQWSNDPNDNLVVGYGQSPELCSDSAGGCYITYEAGGYPVKLFLHRIDRYGYQPWGDRKQIIGELPEQWQAEIIEDGEGGVIVGYEDNEWIPPYYFKSRVRVQKVDSSGSFLWGQTGVQATVVDTNHGLINLVSDGEGGCVILWQDYDGNYYLNRLNSLGQRVWGDSGIYIVKGNFSRSEIINATDGNYYVETGEFIFRIKQNGEFTLWNSSNDWWIIVAAPDGGGIVHSAIWSPHYYTLLAQRKDTLGNNLWQEPYVEIADSLDINTNIKIQYINDHYYYSWLGRKDGIDLVRQLQALRSDGTKLFTQGSIPISSYPVDALLGGIQPSDSGTVVLVWEDFRPDDGVFGQRIDTLGNRLWDPSDISLYTGMYSKLHSITDGNGGAIGLGWHQFDFSLRIFKVSKNGIMGEVITDVHLEENNIIPTETILYQNYPNPFNPITTIKYDVPKQGNIELIIYDILGRKVTTLINEQKQPGRYEAVWDASKIASGIYIYQLRTNDFVDNKKMILLK